MPRVMWDARDALDLDNFELPAEVGVIGHHTAMTDCFTFDECVREMQVIQDFHIDDRGWWDIGYNFLIGQDGRIYEGRGFSVQGAHCSGWNTKTLGFSVMGNFMEKLPTESALAAAKQLMAEMERRNYVAPSCWSFYGHRDKSTTECPGTELYKEFTSWDNFQRECPSHQ